MSFTKALYYPWIEVRDERWLRSACLYWDKIHTIVPSSISNPYSKKVSSELEDAGVLEPLRVNSRQPEIAALTNDVLTFLDSQEAGELLIGRVPGTSTRIHLDKLPRALHGLSRIHNEKFSWELRHRFSELCQSDGEWLQMNDVFADYYMTLLANRIAEKKGLGLLTSSFAADRLINSARSGSKVWAREHGFRTPHSANLPRTLVEGTIVDLLIGELAIAPTVSMKTLLAFREKYSDELGRFRAKIGELTSSVPDAPSFEAARQHAQDLVANEIRPALADLRAALKSNRIKTMTDGLLKVSFLSAAPTSALIAAGLALPTALLVGAGISLSAATVLHSEEKKKLKRENAFTYLFALEQKFA